MLVEIFFYAAFILMALGAIWSISASLWPRVAAWGGSGLLLAGLGAACVPVIAEIRADCWAVFRLAVLILGAAGAIHSHGYLRGHGENRAGVYWFFYNITVAAMLAVTYQENPVCFLVAWEIMGIASFALVAFDYRTKQVLRAAWIYLLACQAGSMFIIALLTFADNPILIFILAVLGFGLKIGFPLLHIWLPEAHPAAPAPVSALMSGAMIQLGFLGILKWGVTWNPQMMEGAFNITLASLQNIYGVTFLVLGCAGSLLGILFSLPRTNLKTILAYSSIENMGIISIGLGLGFLGKAHDMVMMATCGFVGAWLHAINHALLKGGLFLGAGAVLKATGTLELDRMGGLLKRMPATGTLFIMNSCGLCGLPPFNAFISEFLIYSAAVLALMHGQGVMLIYGLAALLVVALTGGLAGAAFVKAAAGAFLGEPRSTVAANATEVPRSMRLPVIALTIIGFGLVFSASTWSRLLAPEFLNPLAVKEVSGLLWNIDLICTIFIVICLVILCAVAWRLDKGEYREGPTWDCGYAAPDARMEYTASAFTQPLADFFRTILCLRKRVDAPVGNFPTKAAYEATSEDPGMTFWKKLFNWVAKGAEKLHVLQSGSLHLYILIMTLALIALLIWAVI